MKPQHLLRILVRSILPTGQGRIFEPFAGSGSTISACKAVGYESVGVEVDDEYFAALRSNIAVLSAIYPTFKGQRLELSDEECSKAPKIRRFDQQRQVALL